MKTGTKLLSSVGLATMMLLTSCNSETSISQYVTAEELAAIKAGFLPLSEKDMESQDLFHSPASRSISNDCILLDLGFHRQWLDCVGGLGICYINPNPLPFPPSFPDVGYDKTGINVSSNTGSAMLLSDAEGSTYIELKFASYPASNMGTFALLYVDEEVTGEYTTNEGVTYATTIPQGAYRYEPNLGTYGGYRVPVILTIQIPNQ